MVFPHTWLFILCNYKCLETECDRKSEMLILLYWQKIGYRYNVFDIKSTRYCSSQQFGPSCGLMVDILPSAHPFSFLLYLPSSYLSIMPGSANFEILIKKKKKKNE